MKKSACAAIACLMLLADGAAAGPNRYGAIAFSESTYELGWAGDRYSRADADNSAMRFCLRRARDCRIVMWVRNACMALASGDEGWGTAYSTSKSEAVAIAMENCQENSDGCRLRIKYCSR